MGIKYIIIIALILFFISIIIFYNKEKPNVNEVIEQSVIQQEEEAIEMEENQEEVIQNEEEAIEDNPPEQLKEMIVDTVINAVDFFLKSDVDIVAIGDSLTQGVGDQTKKGGYIGILDETINHDKKVVAIENYGKAGNRTDQLLKRLDEPEIVSSIKKSEIILITIGANRKSTRLNSSHVAISYAVFCLKKKKKKNKKQNTITIH